MGFRLQAGGLRWTQVFKALNRDPTADDINLALPTIRNLPQLPQFKDLKVMQDSLIINRIM